MKWRVELFGDVPRPDAIGGTWNGIVVNDGQENQRFSQPTTKWQKIRMIFRHLQ
jgi:hypothetical protein